jgi:hypothetical protein
MLLNAIGAAISAFGVGLLAMAFGILGLVVEASALPTGRSSSLEIIEMIGNIQSTERYIRLIGLAVMALCLAASVAPWRPIPAGRWVTMAAGLVSVGIGIRLGFDALQHGSSNTVLLMTLETFLGSFVVGESIWGWSGRESPCPELSGRSSRRRQRVA